MMQLYNATVVAPGQNRLSATSLLNAERRRIAREIHDRVGHQMACLKLKIQSIASNGQGEGLVFAAEGIDLISKSIHDAIHALYDEDAFDGGLCALIEAILEEWGQHNCVIIGFDAEGDFADLDASIAVAILDIVREATTNITKHAAGARHVDIHLSRDGSCVRFAVTDDGIGFAAEGVSHPAGTMSRSARRFGLAGMRERLSDIGGEFSIRSRSGRGTTVSGRIPLARRI